LATGSTNWGWTAPTTDKACLIDNPLYRAELLRLNRGVADADRCPRGRGGCQSDAGGRQSVCLPTTLATHSGSAFRAVPLVFRRRRYH
jgi:hypothetical protein